MDPQQPTPTSGKRRPVRRRRDRHGRGLRGPLLPPHLPARRTPAERFDDLMQDAVERLAQHVGPDVNRAQFRWIMVPDRLEERLDRLRAWGSGSMDHALADSQQNPDGSIMVTLYRRPIEAVAADGASTPANHVLGDLIYLTLVAEWADLTGVSPESIDPDQGD